MNMPGELPLVSVVLATYNGEIFLAKQLESVFQQTYPHIEIIAVDDGSSDNTFSILQEHAARHPNMKVFSNEKNLGYVKNFQRACSLASGELIACCDQDDYWHADKIKKLATAIEDSQLIYCDSFICGADLQPTGKKISDQVVCRSFDSCLQQAVFCRIYGHTTLIKKSLIEKAIPFLEVIPHDWWLSFIATVYGEIKYFPEPLVFYRQHTANLFGVVGVKREKPKQVSKAEKKQKELTVIRTRINAFYEACPQEKIFEKKVLTALARSYSSFSIVNNLKRMLLFFRYRKLLLAVKKQSALRKILFCLKMFVLVK